jgi:hypothetical protein
LRSKSKTRRKRGEANRFGNSSDYAGNTGRHARVKFIASL